MLHPITKWAQRKDKVYLQVQLRDIKDQNIELSQTTLTFVGISDSQKYAFAFEFFDEVDKESSKWSKTGFHLLFVIEKKSQDKPFWPRLLKNKDKNQYLQVDWSKWVDEDEEPEEKDKGLGGFDPSQMQNFGGQGGFPGGQGGFPGGQGGFPGMGGMGGMGGFPGMGGMGGMGDYEGNQEEDEQEIQEKQEEVEKPEQKHEHVHGQNCQHQH